MSKGRESPKRVWILGAGFSRSLGGPLLTELLSQRKRRELEVRYPTIRDIYDCSEAKAVYGLYHYGRAYNEGKLYWDRRTDETPGVQEWKDAEQFLDYLDTAASSDRAAQYLKGLWGASPMQYDGPMHPPQSLAHAARRILSAECCGFMQDFDPALEASEPYIDWARQLTAADTIITFNYDTVVEQVAEACKVVDGETLHGTGVHVVMFERAGDGDKPDVGLELDKAAKANQPILLKLHGSVDWETASNKKFLPFRRAATLDYAATARAEAELCIAVPGPSKKKSTSGELAWLWHLAERKLREADEIVFIGYRFPPTDAQARSRLLGAIAENTPEERKGATSKRARYTLRCKTVLGDDVKSAERLHHLLGYALEASGRVRHEPGSLPRGGRYSVKSVPLFAEDYLSVLDL